MPPDTARRDALARLLADLSAATEGSAELDAAVLRAAGWSKRDDAPQWNDQWGNWRDMKHPTRSLDAIDALIKARGWEWFKDRPLYYDTGTVLDGHAPLFFVGERGGKEWSQHKNDILALCMGFVRALDAQEGGA